MSQRELIVVLLVWSLTYSSGDNLTISWSAFGLQPLPKVIQGLTPNVTVSTNMTLYSTNISLFFSLYQVVYSNVTKMTQTFGILQGMRNQVNSIGRCIAFSVAFPIGVSLPVTDKTATGNGECDALWGRQCSLC
jgi:hypothetical protein